MKKHIWLVTTFLVSLFLLCGCSTSETIESETYPSIINETQETFQDIPVTTTYSPKKTYVALGLSRDFSGGVAWVTSTIEKVIIYDTSLNKVVDLSDYTFITSGADGFYQFKDGIAAVKILGADGNTYLCHIDTKGNFLYDPVKITTYGNLYGNSNASGTALYFIPENAVGENYNDRYILFPDGSTQKILANIDVGSENAEMQFAFYDGYAWSINDYCYLGLDGNVLNTYIYR